LGGKVPPHTPPTGEAIKVQAILKPRFGPKAKYQTWIVEELNDALAIGTIPARPDAR
jgi:hypothetical protein